MGEEADEYFGYILDGTERLRMLIQALLAYSRLGRAELRLESIDTARMVRHILTTVTHDREFHVEVADLPTVVADRAQLGQVFQNLIGNALKFVDGKPAHVVVSAEREEGGWRFAVADNGIGIEPRYVGRIFEVFERLHARDRYAGAGIGLSIC
ncbi:MAG: hypothetical protein QOJ29_2871, partial [Thermoleophilaceae bacterium]|nr:hypothetical protein [Thermoleophilaceae bacterium]